MGFRDVFVGNDGLVNNVRKWEKVKVGDLMWGSLLRNRKVAG
jgi:hypothetical protein